MPYDIDKYSFDDLDKGDQVFVFIGNSGEEKVLAQVIEKKEENNMLGLEIVAENHQHKGAPIVYLRNSDGSLWKMLDSTKQIEPTEREMEMIQEEIRKDRENR